MATYEVGELPERVDDERRRAPLLERFGVPFVELVDEVGVRRRPPWYWVGYCEYCEFMVVVGEGATGKMPELVVREREWPSCASVYMVAVDTGRTPTPGFAMGLRRTGMAPKAGPGAGCAMTADCMFEWIAGRSLDAARRETRISALTSKGMCQDERQ
jgi:hypothetical protein